MDLKDLIPDDTPIVVELKHPSTGEPLGMTITVASRYSEVYEDYLYTKVQERIDRGEAEDKKMSLKELQEENRKMCATLTLDWTIKFDGKKPKLTTDKALEIYSKLKWITPQIEEALAAKEDFTAA
jgi:hypothetical protein